MWIKYHAWLTVTAANSLICPLTELQDPESFCLCSPGRCRLVLSTPAVGWLRLSLRVPVKPETQGVQVSAGLSTWPDGWGDCDAPDLFEAHIYLRHESQAHPWLEKSDYLWDINYLSQATD